MRSDAADALVLRRIFRADDVTDSSTATPRHEQFIGVYLTTEVRNKLKRVYRKASVDVGPVAR